MSKAARDMDAAIKKRRETLTKREAPAEHAPISTTLDDLIGEPWMKRLADLEATAGAAWDERNRRISAGTATPEDTRVHQLARLALQSGSPLPIEATRMPGPELPRSQRTWHPEAMDSPQRAVQYGIPPLIAEEIARGGGYDTKSTRACARVGTDYLILVLIGAWGCGKTYAAAKWLWQTDHARYVPLAIRRRVLQRRLLEAPALADIEFADRPKLGEAVALVIDDLGTEKDFLQQDIARLLVTRYRNGLPTVCTTNMSEVDLVKMYGTRFADRMREVGRFLVVSNDVRDSLRGRDR